jgi:hypothetical protein
MTADDRLNEIIKDVYDNGHCKCGFKFHRRSFAGKAVLHLCRDEEGAWIDPVCQKCDAAERN